ncbi:ABC transporter ATP-binding protein [Nocardioides marmoriginsengisoli]|uniref:ABC transporter ATP-binding protein n=1 Tax=Nocardioides marmoriginsengisoli TaxID=661483 RepID=A0A3N0CPI7_9ACTN|nr:ABC transporter ATP-binding protein [Nocardioides marmoriginsengisoli]RNL65384.1 ABC transporter ATP-binding protein [Nocardioides marmoriginsengisoli]
MTILASKPGAAATAEREDDLLAVENLRVAFGGTEVVKGISFGIRPGRCLAIVGESGSGKSVTARTLVGLTGSGASVRADRLELGPTDLRHVGERSWRGIRGSEIGFVLQDALVSLDQLRRVGDEVGEPLKLHGWGDRGSRAERVVELLDAVGVPEPELRARQRPYELSGGLRQRALIASAIALDPPLLIADEPTTALDVTVQAQVLDLLAASKERGTAIILISHDLSVVARLADEVAVMRHGEIVEHGPTAEVLRAPRHEYTRALIAAVPSEHTRGTRLVAGSTSVPRTRRPIDRGRPLLEARHLTKVFRGPDGVDRTVVDDVSFEVFAGETVGIVGESGSGKTTTARIALALLGAEGGEVRLRGNPWSTLSDRDRRPLRSRVGVVYQDPLSSFDPRWPVGRILADALTRGPTPPSSKEESLDRIVRLLEQVGLGRQHVETGPLRLSGGQRQRVAIARALAPEPELIVCDEPVSALDVSVQAQVLDLFTDLQDELGVTYLFISHDLGVIHHLSDRVLVMKDGRVVERGTADDIFLRPQDEYTQRLLTALPRLEQATRGQG